MLPSCILFPYLSNGFLSLVPILEQGVLESCSLVREVLEVVLVRVEEVVFVFLVMEVVVLIFDMPFDECSCAPSTSFQFSIPSRIPIITQPLGVPILIEIFA